MRPQSPIPLLLSFLILLASACSSLGVAKPQGFDQKLAYAFGVHTAVLQSAVASINSGALSKPDGAQLLALADESRALLDAAKLVSAQGDMTAANSKLLLATSILTQIQNYLNSRSKS